VLGIMEFKIIVLLSVVCGILLVTNYLITKNHKTSAVINALLAYFSGRREKILELRTTKEKSTENSVREFEIKTMNQRYYTVLIKGRNVISVVQIERFSIAEEECNVRAVRDLVKLDRFEIIVNKE
jgi:hypothetical protein